ncbi:UDP-N-acetylmuramoyl-L-alanine--D-glutamate ligase [Paenarthrobacter sp. PH39-S1]|uniref:UDP-N-acetylmuramoyl-L-alanine--D-glutamate ligase n=1 Tax=Paenarthrobacter sp. PH39-S1 TaxID=3046204 RepID=UPI0024BB6662|nr:UDP-N-acetylmuramoyl-L-alanine--D-glutamate ligase [Paenarthrobacter sp. PH39-S1]MDJ0356944.1 UDP-N-acetylmuramoyl-L-alanine--D-glutamate ligase [Paenarthrobacter sp. PH39-S1]
MDCPIVSRSINPSGDVPKADVPKADPDRLAALTSWDADWSGLRVVVTGITKTGFSAADTLAELGARVVVVAASDDGEARRNADTLRIVGVADVLLGEETSTRLPQVDGEQAELVVTTPGMRPSHPLLVAAAAAGIPVWGDIELAWRVRIRAGRKTADWITITGTNGKTTTTTMVELMLQAGGLRAIAAGNIGTPILDAVREPEGYDVLAVELSTFQLHWIHTVSPAASVCLNLAEDHVDWHGSFAAYAADKAKIYANTRLACVYNAEQDETERMVEAADVVEGCRAIGFTTGIPAISMVGVVDGLLVDRAFIAERKHSAVELAKVSDIAELVPRHLVANALAAAALVRAYGLEPGAIRDGLHRYESGEHRIQPVASVNGVLWVNDSKATNAHAAAASLSAFDSVIWIAGGLSKGVNYDELIRRHGHRLKAVILIGADTSALSGSLRRHAPDVPVIETRTGQTGNVQTGKVQTGNVQTAGDTQPPDTQPGRGGPPLSGETVMARAVASAASIALRGDTVLMAPASASMDQFASYAQRGEAFISAVRGLVEGQAKAGKEF